MSPSPSPPPAPVIKAIRIRQGFDDFKYIKIVMQDWALSDPANLPSGSKKSDETRNTVVWCTREYQMPVKAGETYSMVKELRRWWLRKNTIAWSI